jgi:hypothetical protein
VGLASRDTHRDFLYSEHKLNCHGILMIIISSAKILRKNVSLAIVILVSYESEFIRILNLNTLPIFSNDVLLMYIFYNI